MRYLVLYSLLFVFNQSFTQSAAILDMIDFGEAKSEKKHQFSSAYSTVYSNENAEKGRRLLPKDTAEYRGGNMAFTLKTDPTQQNYFTVRCWGNETDVAMVMLFIEGLQVGYRHLGDIDLLHRGNDDKPAYGKYYYITLPLPLQHTQGKSQVRLELRAYGPIWDYGNNFEQYQKKLETPSRTFYAAYTHVDPFFQSPTADRAYVDLNKLPIRSSPGAEVMERLKQRVNESLQQILAKNAPANQLEAWFLADAFHVKWTAAFQNEKVIPQVNKAIDAFYLNFREDPKLVYNDPNVYNYEWLTIGPFARCIRQLWPQLQAGLAENIDLGNGQNISRHAAWTELLQAALAYSTTHRRQYTNQSMIIDMFMYDCNRALLLLEPSKALPEYQLLRYLYESVGLAPWLGSETASGSEKPLGENYWQLTDKGLTKELGFVGTYGEVLDWVVDMYKSSAWPGRPETGDPKIREQLLNMMRARSYFRYPSADKDGFRAMRLEALVGWRDGNHYPGDVLYGDRGIAWDATPLMTAAVTRDSQAIAQAQQMLEDNQFFMMLEKKMNLNNSLRVTKSLLQVPDEYEWLKALPQSTQRLPMSLGMPDFVFSDEEDGVVAIKNGDDILYASLYWRARNAVNKLAKVHYISAQNERVANIYLQSNFSPSNMEYIRPNWVNLGFGGFREFYPGLNSAHAGEKLPIAKIPEGIKFKAGDENVYAGRADYYQLQYGNYLIAMNTSAEKSFELEVPVAFSQAQNLVNQEALKSKNKLTLSPRSTVVLYKTN